MNSDRPGFFHDTSQSEATFGRYDKLPSDHEQPHDLLKVVEDPYSATDRKNSNKENSLLSVSGGKDRYNKLSNFYRKQSSNQPTASSFISEDFREKGIYSDIRLPELHVNGSGSKYKLGAMFRQGTQKSQVRLDGNMMKSTVKMDTIAISDGKTISTPGPPGMPNPRTSTIITFSMHKSDLLSRGIKVEGFHQTQPRNFNQTMSNRYGGETTASPIPAKGAKRGSAVFTSSTKNNGGEGIGISNNPNLMKLVLLKRVTKDSMPLGSKSGALIGQKDSEVIDEDDEEEFLENYPSEVEETMQMEDSKQHNELEAKEFATPLSKHAGLSSKFPLKMRKPPKLMTGVSNASSRFTGSSQSGFNRDRLNSADARGESDSLHIAHRNEHASIGSGPFNLGRAPSFLRQDTQFQNSGTVHLEEEILSMKNKQSDAQGPERISLKLDSVYEVKDHIDEKEYKPFRDYMEKIGLNLEKIIAQQPSTRSPSFSNPPVWDSSATTQPPRSPDLIKTSEVYTKSTGAKLPRPHKYRTQGTPVTYPIAQAALIPETNGFKNRFKFAGRLDQIVRSGCVTLY